MSDNDLHRRFRECVHPRVQRWARVNFKRNDDAVAEAVGLAWKWFTSMANRGKDGTLFPSAIAQLAVRAVRSGRRVAKSWSANDVLSFVAQRRHGFTTSTLPEHETLSDNPLTDALISNTQTPVDEAAAFRIDFNEFRQALSERDQRIMDDMMMNERTMDIAAKHGISAGRVSQLRRSFQDAWSVHGGSLP